MHLRSIISLALLCIACGPRSARPTTLPDQTKDEFSAERAFFDRLQALSNGFDPKVVDLYADDIVLTSARTLPDGTVKSVELRGAQVKQILAQALPIAKANGDRDRYSGIRFGRVEGGVRVQATRYSERKCTTDPNYSLVLRAVGPSFVVAREESATQALSACPDQDPAPMIGRMVAAIEAHLPVALDADTRLDAVAADSKTLVYRITLVTLLPEQVRIPDLDAQLRKLWVAQACLRPDTRPLLDNGASLRYELQWKDGRAFTSITLNEMDCS